MRQRRKRSAAITLLLAGTMSGCGEPVPQALAYSWAWYRSPAAFSTPPA
jgi:hypothetical protein